MMYKTNNTKNLLPKSDIAALASDVSPRNSRMNGKQDNPGAKDGINRCALLPFSDLLSIPMVDNRIGVTRNRRLLKPITRNGSKTKWLLISTFKRAIKMVAGRAMDSTKLFKPLVCSSVGIFFFRRIPIRIKSKNERVFSIAPSMN